MNTNAQPTPEDRVGEVVVTKDGPFYWVRQNEDNKYWPNRGLFFFKFFALKRAKEIADANRVLNGHEIVVWSSHD